MKMEAIYSSETSVDFQHSTRCYIPGDSRAVLAASLSFLAYLILRPWRWRRHVPPKHRLTFNGIHGFISPEDGTLHLPLALLTGHREMAAPCVGWCLCSFRYRLVRFLYRLLSFSVRGSSDASICYGMLSGACCGLLLNQGKAIITR
jgi:hypothetical protein